MSANPVYLHLSTRTIEQPKREINETAGRDVGLLAITSANRLNAGLTAASQAREHSASMP